MGKDRLLTNNESGRCKENSSFRLERSEGGYDVGLPLRESAIGDDVVDVVVVYLSLCLYPSSGR